ncbi:hypothetical protein BDZ89DRAFT_252468 [Hymenopellis radicata]|nr:hypothetical protein BDZ89DRAFT_252468 [Hymenopellis radicata]
MDAGSVKIPGPNSPHCATCTCHGGPIGTSHSLPPLPVSIEQHLFANEAPRPDDIPILHGCLPPLDASLTRLDEEIAALSSLRDQLRLTLQKREVALEKLTSERAACHERQQKLLGAVSALRRFPLEILQNIFLMVIPDDLDCGFPVLSDRDGPWAVSRVCRRWRDAAQWPQLWTSFQITSYKCGWSVCDSCDNIALTGCTDPSALLQTVLDRSGSHKLSFHFEFDFDDYANNPRRIEDLLDTLMEHSERWERVTFDVPTALGVWLGDIRGEVSALKELVFTCCDPDWVWETVEENSIRVVRAFEVAPLLTDVSVRNAYLALDCSRLLRFTSRSDSYIPVPIDVLSVLRRAPALSYLNEASLAQNHTEWLTVGVPRITRSLEYLSTANAFLLRSLNLPCLDHLEVGSRKLHTPLPYLPFIADCLRASQCSITTLHLSNCDFSIGFLPTIVALSPGLKKLMISFSCQVITPDFNYQVDVSLGFLIHSLSQMVDDGDGGNVHHLAPLLEDLMFSFDVRSDQEWSFVNSALVDMIDERRRDEDGNGNGMLSMVHLVFRPHPRQVLPLLMDHDIARLRVLKASGFSVDIFRKDVDDSSIL